MDKRIFPTALIVAALALAVGPARAAPPPPAGGTIAIEPKTASGDYDAATQSFVEAAGAALARRGFTMLDDPGHAAYVAELILSRADIGTATAKIPPGRASAGPGAAFGTGAGVTVPLSSGQTALVPLQRTRLDLRIHKRGDPAIVWSGAAVTVRSTGARGGTEARVAADLSEAVLRSYPAEPREVVGVP